MHRRYTPIYRINSLLCRSIFKPVGVLWGIKDKKVYKIADIPELEKAYNLSKTLPHKTVQVCRNCIY